MLRAFRQIAVLSTFSRILGMARDMAIAYTWGRSRLTDLWVIAFMIPNLARRVLGEGGLGSAAIPAYHRELHKDPRSASILAGTIVTSLVLATAAIAAIVLAIAMAWARLGASGQQILLIRLVILMLPYMVLTTCGIALGAILNAHQHFIVPACSPVILNLGILSALMALWATGRHGPTSQILIVSGSVVLAGVVQVLLHIVALKRYRIQIRPCLATDLEPFRAVLKVLVPVVIGLTVTQTNTLLNNILAYWATGPDRDAVWFELLGHRFRYPLTQGSAAALYYAQRIYQFPLGVLGVSLATAVLPAMSRDSSVGNMYGLGRQTARAVHTALFIALPSSILLLICGRLAIEVLFQYGRFTADDTTAVWRAVACYGLGLCSFFLQQVLTPTFYSMPGDGAMVPLRTGLIAIVANMISSVLLLWPTGTAGLAASTSIAASIQVIMLVIGIDRRLGRQVWQGTGRLLSRLFICAIACGSAAWVVLVLSTGMDSTRLLKAIRLMLAVALAGSVYIGLARGLGLWHLAAIRPGRSG